MPLRDIFKAIRQPEWTTPCIPVPSSSSGVSSSLVPLSSSDQPAASSSISSSEVPPASSSSVVPLSSGSSSLVPLSSGSSSLVPLSSGSSSLAPDDLSAYYGLVAAFYDGIDLLAPRLNTDVTPDINYIWGSTRPAWMPADNWSARFMGYVIPEHTGPTVFRLLFQNYDSVRMWVNGVLLFDTWDTPNTPTGAAEGSIDLEEGYPYPVIIEYKDIGGYAALSLLWSFDAQAMQPVPSRCLRPVDLGDKVVTPDPSSEAYTPVPLVLHIRGSSGFDVSTCVLSRVDVSAWGR
jgi:hypothetical protein